MKDHDDARKIYLSEVEGVWLTDPLEITSSPPASLPPIAVVQFVPKGKAKSKAKAKAKSKAIFVAAPAPTIPVKPTVPVLARPVRGGLDLIQLACIWLQNTKSASDTKSSSSSSQVRQPVCPPPPSLKLRQGVTPLHPTTKSQSPSKLQQGGKGERTAPPPMQWPIPMDEMWMPLGGLPPPFTPDSSNKDADSKDAKDTSSILCPRTIYFKSQTSDSKQSGLQTSTQLIPFIQMTTASGARLIWWYLVRLLTRQQDRKDSAVNALGEREHLYHIRMDWQTGHFIDSRRMIDERPFKLFEVDPNFQAMAHQVEFVRKMVSDQIFLHNQERCVNADEPGLGKTIETLKYLLMTLERSLSADESLRPLFTPSEGKKQSGSVDDEESLLTLPALESLDGKEKKKSSGSAAPFYTDSEGWFTPPKCPHGHRLTNDTMGVKGGTNLCPLPWYKGWPGMGIATDLMRNFKILVIADGSIIPRWLQDAVAICPELGKCIWHVKSKMGNPDLKHGDPLGPKAPNPQGKTLSERLGTLIVVCSYGLLSAAGKNYQKWAASGGGKPPPNNSGGARGVVKPPRPWFFGIEWLCVVGDEIQRNKNLVKNKAKKSGGGVNSSPFDPQSDINGLGSTPMDGKDGGVTYAEMQSLFIHIKAKDKLIASSSSSDPSQSLLTPFNPSQDNQRGSMGASAPTAKRIEMDDDAPASDDGPVSPVDGLRETSLLLGGVLTRLIAQSVIGVSGTPVTSDRIAEMASVAKFVLMDTTLPGHQVVHWEGKLSSDKYSRDWWKRFSISRSQADAYRLACKYGDAAGMLTLGPRLVTYVTHPLPDLSNRQKTIIAHCTLGGRELRPPATPAVGNSDCAIGNSGGGQDERGRNGEDESGEGKEEKKSGKSKKKIKAKAKSKKGGKVGKGKAGKKTKGVDEDTNADEVDEAIDMDEMMGEEEGEPLEGELKSIQLLALFLNIDVIGVSSFLIRPTFAIDQGINDSELEHRYRLELAAELAAINDDDQLSQPPPLEAADSISSSTQLPALPASTISQPQPPAIPAIPPMSIASTSFLPPTYPLPKIQDESIAAPAQLALVAKPAPIRDIFVPTAADLLQDSPLLQEIRKQVKIHLAANRNIAIASSQIRTLKVMQEILTSPIDNSDLGGTVEMALLSRKNVAWITGRQEDVKNDGREKERKRLSLPHSNQACPITGLHHARIVFLTTRSGGAGLDLTACQVMMLTDHTFNPTADEQLLKRIDRVTQRRPIFQHVFYYESEFSSDNWKRMVHVRSLAAARVAARYLRGGKPPLPPPLPYGSAVTATLVETDEIDERGNIEIDDEGSEGQSELEVPLCGGGYANPVAPKLSDYQDWHFKLRNACKRFCGLPEDVVTVNSIDGGIEQVADESITTYTSVPSRKRPANSISTSTNNTTGGDYASTYSLGELQEFARLDAEQGWGIATPPEDDNREDRSIKRMRQTSHADRHNTSHLFQ